MDWLQRIAGVNQWDFESNDYAAFPLPSTAT
jgi:hypothetical protein